MLPVDPKRENFCNQQQVMNIMARPAICEMIKFAPDTFGSLTFSLCSLMIALPGQAGGGPV